MFLRQPEGVQIRRVIIRIVAEDWNNNLSPDGNCYRAVSLPLLLLRELASNSFSKNELTSARG